MLKSAAILFGIVFLAVGVLGFVPGVTNNEMLLGIFHVNLAHNVVHLASGAVFLFAGMAGAGPARLWFRVFGIVYALVAVMGFLHMGQDTNLLGMVSNNDADTWLHVVLAIAMLGLGFGVRDTATA